jgi:hypothetical protein
MASTSGRLARFKQPEYTGENRCLPCTVVNTIIALVLSVAVVAGVARVANPAAGLAAGVVLLGCCLGAIYFRGYLVPGTPELTKQYFPPWLLGLFGKEPEVQTNVAADTEIDPEAELLGVGALEPCEESDDLCLTASFRESWFEEIDRVNAESDASRDRLLALLGLEEANVRFTEHGRAFQAFVDGTVVGRWESEAAFLADLGAAQTLSREYDGWDELAVESRGQLLNGLRLFIDRCPECGGVPSFETETVESCCSTQDVAAVTCEDCDSRLFESAI